MRAFSILALLALTGVFAVAQYTPRQQQPPPDMPQAQQPPPSDQSKPGMASTADVQGDIQAALQKEPSLANSNINVQVTGQNVDLTGTVPNKDAKDTAEQIAKAHAGSLGVKNHLKVGGGGDAQPPR